MALPNENDIPQDVIDRSTPKARAFGGSPPGTVLEGFLGYGNAAANPPADTWRLYTSRALDAYFEILDTDLKEASITLEGTSIIRVDPDAVIIYARVIKVGAAVSYLGGAVAARYLNGADSGGLDDPPGSTKCAGSL